MEKIMDCISSANGSISAMRVAMLLVITAILFNWVYLTVVTGQKQPLDWTEVAAILGALGMKAAQRPFESPAPEGGNNNNTQEGK
jgi:uncharacterized BrkB/YihY/UPF0761 family membrane protein